MSADLKAFWHEGVVDLRGLAKRLNNLVAQICLHLIQTEFYTLT